MPAQLRRGMSLAAAAALTVAGSLAAGAPMFGAIGTANATASHATISLSATSALRDSTVRVRGTGFGSAERLAVYFGSTREGVTRTWRSGRFGPVTVAVPAYVSAGRHRIWAESLRTHRTAAITFTVVADWPSWPQSRFGVSQNGYDNQENELRPGNVALLKTAWTFTAGGAFNSSAVVAGRTVFITPSDNSIDALNATSGALKWSVDFANQQYSTPAVVNGTVYVGASVEGKPYAFSAKTGTEKWFFQTGDRVQAAPTVDGGVIYVCSDQVYAVDTSGHKLWSFAGSGGFESSPAVDNGVVYAASTDGNFYAIDASTGQEKWHLTIGGRRGLRRLGRPQDLRVQGVDLGEAVVP